MSTILSTTVVDRPAALVAQPRPRVALGLSTTGARLHADDAQPRLNGALMTTTPTTTIPAWRRGEGFGMRGFELGRQAIKAGRTATFGGAYVTTSTDKQHSTRSGPPTDRP